MNLSFHSLVFLHNLMPSFLPHLHTVTITRYNSCTTDLARLHLLTCRFVCRLLKNVEHFLLPTDTHNAEIVELLKHSKIDKNAPTCFGLHRDHLQGAKVSTWLPEDGLYVDRNMLERFYLF